MTNHEAPVIRAKVVPDVAGVGEKKSENQSYGSQYPRAKTMRGASTLTAKFEIRASCSLAASLVGPSHLWPLGVRAFF